MKISSISFCMAAALLAFKPASQAYTSWDYLAVIQASDFAGMGTVTAASNSVLSVAVSEYWLGGLAQTNISIQNAYTEFVDESQSPPGVNPNPFPDLPGKKVVFFGVTNEWKYLSCGASHADRLFDWDLPNCLTNGGVVVAPKFYDIHMPAWFVVESNTSARVSFLSNITDCVFSSRAAP